MQLGDLAVSGNFVKSVGVVFSRLGAFLPGITWRILILQINRPRSVGREF